MVLGLTNGEKNVGVTNFWDNTGALFSVDTYGSTISTATGSSPWISGRFGITKDSSKSGIVAEVTLPTLTVSNIPMKSYIKY